MASTYEATLRTWSGWKRSRPPLHTQVGGRFERRVRIRSSMGTGLEVNQIADDENGILYMPAPEYDGAIGVCDTNSGTA